MPTSAVTSANSSNRWWTRLLPRRIGRRLSLGFGLLVTLMLLALWNAGMPLAVVADATERFAAVDMQRLLRVQALSLQTEGAGSALIRLMNAPRDNRVMEYTDVDERNRRIDGIIESLKAELHDPVQEQTLKHLGESRVIYADAFIATVDQIEAQEPAEAARLINERVNPALKAMLMQSNALLDRERNRIESQLAESQQLIHRIMVTAGIFSLLLVAMAIWLAWRTTKSVVTPLSELEQAAQRIAAGDYRRHALLSSTEEVDRVGQALSTMTDAIAARELEIEHLAFHDPLTDLPNRTFLLKAGVDATSRLPGSMPACHSLMLFDLARLKTINETLGFSTGDTLIKEVAARAQKVLHQTHVQKTLLAHVSGGTFAIVFEYSERALVELVRQQLWDAMAHPMLCGVHSVDLSLTFGLADRAPDEATSVMTLLRNAEVALDSAKRAAHSFAWYSTAQEAARLSHLGLISDLRVAAAQSQLQMWLQPKFSLQTGEAVGAEALVRWQGTHPQLSISVNVSTRDLQDATFCQRVQQRLQHHGIAPKKLRLEIVESGVMQDAHASIALLYSLREAGVELSIDDFGTGYSSLAYLQQLPVSELKIDRSFVTDIDSKPGSFQLVKTMIEMGHGMGLLVTAEGIETAAERDTLQQLGCDVMQGYFGSRPLHGMNLQAWLDHIGDAPRVACP